MWWVICLIAIFIGIFIIYTFDENFGLGIIAFICFSILILFVHSLLWRDTAEEYEEEQYKIQGLENNIITDQNIKGTFILGFGYVKTENEERMKYYYFKVNDIGKKLEEIDVTQYSNIYIRETDEIEPCLIHRYKKSENKGFFRWLFGKCELKDRIATILVVPSNTIKIEYNVDIKD